MPQGNGYSVDLIARMHKYEKKEHDVLLAQARRPPSVLTEDHVEYLRRMMVEQNRFQHGFNNIKTTWLSESGDE